MVVSIAGVSRATVFNVTEQRVQISSDGKTLKGRSSVEADLDDEVLTSALERGDVVVLSQQQVTQEPEKKAPEEPVAENETASGTGAESAEATVAEEVEATGQEHETVSQAEEATETSEEETKSKKSARAKVAKEN